jgi:hypothetical protein
MNVPHTTVKKIVVLFRSYSIMVLVQVFRRPANNSQVVF